MRKNRTNVRPQEVWALALIGMTRIRSAAPSSAHAMLDRFIKAIPERIRPDKVLLKQSILVLLACALIDLFPGFFMGRFEEYLVLVPGLLMILPPTVGLRGNIFGALAARVSSRLHLGTIDPHFRQNKELRVHLLASGVQLVMLSVAIPLVGLVMGILFSIEMAGVHELLFISISGALISGLLMFAISLGITFISFRKGWDPDNVSAPITASAGDILTIPILFLCAFLALNLPTGLVWMLSLTATLVIILSGILLSLSEKKRSTAILREAIPIAILAVVISTISGLFLGVAFNSFLKGSLFLILIPAFNGQGGSMGSILGSRVTSAAYLGQVKITRIPNQLAVSSAVSLMIISLIAFSFIGLGGAFLGYIAGGLSFNIPELVITLLIGSVLITISTSMIAYYIAYLSFKIGLDPDNVVIPLLTACMDVVGSGSLILGMIITGILF